MRHFLFVGLALLSAGTAQSLERSSEEIRQRRQAIIDGIISSDPSADVAIDRQNCMAGRMPDLSRRSRQNDGGTSPNPADWCVAALMRSGRDNVLLVPYKEIVLGGGGDVSLVDDLPGSIGGAVIDQASNKVSIGKGKSLVIDAATAFDAGFSAGYLKGETTAPGMPDLPTLKTISESCLDRADNRLGLCYAAGYAHAVRALQGETVLAD